MHTEVQVQYLMTRRKEHGRGPRTSPIDGCSLSFMKGRRKNKSAALARIAKQIESCRRCRQQALGKPVAGEGSPDAEIVFVGEAPGRMEAESGRPFVGKAGQWLRRAIRGIGLDESSVYLTSPVKYRPARG